MWNAELDESQAGIKTTEKNTNNLKTCRWHHAYSRKLRGNKSLLMRVKEESVKAGLKLSIQKTKIMASGLITSWQIDGEKMETVTDLFSWAPKSLWTVTSSHKIKRYLLLEEKLWQT